MPDSACPSEPLHRGNCDPRSKKSQGADDHTPRHKEITEPQFRGLQEREKVHRTRGFSCLCRRRKPPSRLKAFAARQFFARVLEIGQLTRRSFVPHGRRGDNEWQNFRTSRRIEDVAGTRRSDLRQPGCSTWHKVRPCGCAFRIYRPLPPVA